MGSDILNPSLNEVWNSCSAISILSSKLFRSIYGEIENINEHEHEHEHEHPLCAICRCEIREGNRVAVMPCPHVFHSDCLKQWLRWKNQCPLCQVSEVASPVHEVNVDPYNENQNEEVNNNELNVLNDSRCQLEKTPTKGQMESLKLPLF